MIVKKKENYQELTNFIMVGLIIVLILSVLFLFGVYYLKPVLSKQTPQIYYCGDGTPYNHCSLNKPYFCKEKILYEKASKCGCIYGYNKSGEICNSSLYANPKLIDLNYYLRFQKERTNFVIYEGVYSYVSRIPQSINSSSGKEVTRSDFELKKINDEIQREAILPLVVKIQNKFPDNKEDQARAAISIVQNIPYREVEGNFSKNESASSKYPYQVLYDNSGTCEEKSELLVLILKELGYGTAIFYYPYENHEAVGIKCPFKNSLDSSRYCFVETTASSIITDDKGYYLDGSQLNSKPIIIPISNGTSLPSNMYEYYDSKTMIKIREDGRLNIFNKNIISYLNEKYGMN